MLEVLVKTNLILLSMIKKRLLLLCVGLTLSSCFAVHPELQRAKSADTGAHSYSLGVYGGANVLNETYGVAGVYNYGLTDKVNWSTDGAFSVQASSLKRVFQGFGVHQYNLSTGPKFSMLNDQIALRLPATVTFTAEELFLSASPTMLWDVLDEKATLFLRYNRLYERNAIEGYFGDLVFGFNYFIPFYSNQLLLSIHSNGVGLYGGVGITL
tara:strand:- start:136 stop:771 length:636 start_codon:yes stop_codon:yes gene_type:complete